MQYSVSNPVCTEFHFSALHHGDYVLWAELWFVAVVVCWCAKKQRVRQKYSENYRRTRRMRLTGLSPFARKFHRTYDKYFYFYFIPTWRVILTTIAVFLFTRRFRRYAIEYSASNPVRAEFHFSALHHGD
jgi:hypothetical protein